ncbi:MAG: hypothetical protein U9R08_03660 [Nanoarchaeota archaeon]|nr:hypothetical protein [Nanoarchaeota archaeon]
MKNNKKEILGWAIAEFYVSSGRFKAFAEVHFKDRFRKNEFNIDENVYVTGHGKVYPDRSTCK